MFASELVPYMQKEPYIKNLNDGILFKNNHYVVLEALHNPVIKVYHEYAQLSSASTVQFIKRLFGGLQWALTTQAGATISWPRRYEPKQFEPHQFTQSPELSCESQ